MKRLLTVFLSVILVAMLFANIPVKAAQTKETIIVNVDGAKHVVRALNHEYDNNLYISMKDMAYAMNKTGKAFELNWTERDGETIAVLQEVTSGSMTEYDEPQMLSGDDEDNEVKHTRKKVFIELGGNEYCFYAIPVKEDGKNDCYVNLGEFALAMNIEVTSVNGLVNINSKNEFDFNNYDIEDSGIPYMADSCLVGDVTTGKVYYSTNADEVVAIASTSKLMTYLIIMDAVSEGRISLNDTVTFSKKASDLSKTSNGVIKVEPGKTADINDVIKGMLIVSSNECALALAEHLSGTEEAFVELMNRKVTALGLSKEARFYNPHGLPVYLDDELTIKQSNHLKASDMFMIAGHILDKYPEITEVTSIKKTNLASFGNLRVNNTNMLLHNVPGTVGLKTGTTDKAASCLVSAYEAKDNKGNTHYIVTIVYGAENAQTQGYVSMLLMRYGIQQFNTLELGLVPERGEPGEVPENLDGLVSAVLGAARRNSR